MKSLFVGTQPRLPASRRCSSSARSSLRVCDGLSVSRTFCGTRTPGFVRRLKSARRNWMGAMGGRGPVFAEEEKGPWAGRTIAHNAALCSAHKALFVARGWSAAGTGLLQVTGGPLVSRDRRPQRQPPWRAPCLSMAPLMSSSPKAGAAPQVLFHVQVEGRGGNLESLP